MIGWYILFGILGIIAFFVIIKLYLKKIHAKNPIFPNLNSKDVEVKKIDNYHLAKHLAKSVLMNKSHMKKYKAKKEAVKFAQHIKDEEEKDKKEFDEEEKRNTKLGKRIAILSWLFD